MIGSFFALTDVNKTKQRLVDTEALSKRSELRRSAQKSDLRQLHCKLIKT